MLDNANWNFPTAIHFGVNRVQHIASDCQQLSIKQPLIVTDPGLAEQAMIADMLATLETHNITAVVFSDVQSNPTEANIIHGVEQFKLNHCDGVIAIGGGSSLDAAKTIAFMQAQSRSVWDFEDVGDNYLRASVDKLVPVIAIPTTAGTGSEVGRAAVILNEVDHSKKIIFHPSMLPEKVILDPMLTVSLPAQLTAATGMDALAHNFEALCAPGLHPMADGIAIEGIRLIKDYLPRAYKNGNDIEARSYMLMAAAMGATAFQKGLGAVHALSHPLGGLYNAHHGLLNGILLPYVLRLNREAIDAPLTRLAAYLSFSEPSVESIVDWIIALRKDISIPDTLSQWAIDKSDYQRIIAMSLEDPSAAGNPVPVTEEYVETLLDQALQGIH